MKVCLWSFFFIFYIVPFKKSSINLKPHPATLETFSLSLNIAKAHQSINPLTKCSFVCSLIFQHVSQSFSFVLTLNYRDTSFAGQQATRACFAICTSYAGKGVGLRDCVRHNRWPFPCILPSCSVRNRYRTLAFRSCPALLHCAQSIRVQFRTRQPALIKTKRNRQRREKFPSTVMQFCGFFFVLGANKIIENHIKLLIEAVRKHIIASMYIRLSCNFVCVHLHPQAGCTHIHRIACALCSNEHREPLAPTIN